MSELLKAQTNQGRKPSLFFLRDKEGHEIDAMIETAPGTWQAVEIKSGETIASDFFDTLTIGAPNSQTRLSPHDSPTAASSIRKQRGPPCCRGTAWLSCLIP